MHEAITFQLDQPLNRSLASKLQKVYQYHKANPKNDIQSLCDQSVEDNWVLFRDTLLNTVEKYHMFSYSPYKLINTYQTSNKEKKEIL